jgi:GT2 family glycosyltransferase
VSIVFLAYNRREELLVSLDQVLHHLDYPEDRLEVMVVDNASTDGTAEAGRERYPRVQVIRNPENIGASGWNVGMTTACGDWRMILDDDCYISGDALKHAIHRAEEERADLVSFRVVSSVDPSYSFNDQYHTGLLTYWGCSAIFSRRAIESEPFYDPNMFIWANEMELTMRLLNRGFRHLHMPEIESVHMKAPDISFHERLVRLNARHYAYIAAKLMRPRDAAVAVSNLVLHTVFGAYSEDTRGLSGLLEIPGGLVAGLRSRAPVRREVSRTYRRHTWHFANPLWNLRSPLARLRSGTDPERIKAERKAKNARWYARRAEYYPAGTAVLEL